MKTPSASTCWRSSTAARPKHIAELKECQKIYNEVFKELTEKAQLHLRSRYADTLPDPFKIDDETTAAGSRQNGRA